MAPYWTDHLEELQELVIQDFRVDVTLQRTFSRRMFRGMYRRPETLAEILEMWAGTQELLLECIDLQEVVGLLQAALAAPGLISTLPPSGVKVQAIFAGSTWEVLCQGAPARERSGTTSTGDNSSAAEDKASKFQALLSAWQQPRTDLELVHFLRDATTLCNEPIEALQALEAAAPFAERLAAGATAEVLQLLEKLCQSIAQAAPDLTADQLVRLRALPGHDGAFWLLDGPEAPSVGSDESLVVLERRSQAFQRRDWYFASPFPGMPGHLRRPMDVAGRVGARFLAPILILTAPYAGQVSMNANMGKTDSSAESPLTAAILSQALLVLLPSLTTPYHHRLEVAMAFKSLRLALGCFLLALLALVVVPRTLRKEKGTFQVPSRFAPTRALEASIDDKIQAVESVIPDGSVDLRAASAAEIEATETTEVRQGNQSLSSSKTAVISESLSAGSASTQPASTGSEEPLITAGPESKEDFPSGPIRHTDESVPKTTLENEHLLDEDSLQLYQTSMTVVKDAAVSSPKALSDSLDGLVIAPDCRCTFILSGAHPPADPQCLHNCSRIHFVNNHGGIRTALANGPLAFPHEHEEL
ncbi:unnamed protein product [Symbiodinium sp. CCMP2456]|nr:unnamed protein product [Symbiodinium sp. CCMP2456]